MSEEVYAVAPKGFAVVILADAYLQDGYTFEEVVEMLDIPGDDVEGKISNLRLLMYMAHEGIEIDVED